MNTPHVTQLNLNESNHPEFLLFGRPALAEKQQARAEMNQPGRSANELKRLRDDALQLIAGRFGITLESLQDSSFRRQYRRLMPLVAWLLENASSAMKPLLSCWTKMKAPFRFGCEGFPQITPVASR